MDEQNMMQAQTQSQEQQLSIDEVTRMLGDHQIVRFKQGQQIQALFKQIQEMSQVIEKLSAQVGKGMQVVEGGKQ